MHLHKIADFMNFREAAIGGTIPDTAKYREMLKKMHPLQMLSSNIVIPLFEISYSYTTIGEIIRMQKNMYFFKTMKKSI